MSSKRRFSVCVDSELVEKLDRMVEDEGYANRSQAVSAMIGDRILKHHEKQATRIVTGTITLVFDHHKRGLQAKMTDIQHGYQKNIIAQVHLHLTRHLCMEVLLVKGKNADLRTLARELTTLKGVTHGELSVTAAEG
jgi:CopG family nickel-responsive transcriptional regulator